MNQDLFELARLKRERNLVRKTRALAAKGIDYAPRYDGDALTDQKASQESVIEVVAQHSPHGTLEVPSGPENAGLEGPAHAAPQPESNTPEGQCRISVTVRGETQTVVFDMPGVAGMLPQRDDLRRLMLAALQTQFGKRITYVNDLP